MRGLSRRSLLPLALAALAPAARGDDWPQWMGPNRDGVWKETGILDKFPAGGPKKLWSVPVGGGYAGPAVAGGKVYLFDRKLAEGGAKPANDFDAKTKVPGTERLLCLDAKTGKELWRHEYDCPYQVSYSAGPRCTPTVAGGKVYTLGTMGDLHCVDAEKGTPVWQKDFKADYGAKTPMWGFTGHPLVYQNLVIVPVGGDGALLVAFDKDTGKEVWKAGKGGPPGYSPAQLIEVNGAPQVVHFHPAAVAGYDPKTGKELWSVPLEPVAQDDMSIMTPRQAGDVLFAAARGGIAVALKLGGGAPAEVWKGNGKTTGLYPINSTPFVEGGVIYGVDMPGMLRAVELKTGKRLWYTFEPVIEKEEEEGFQGAGTGTAFLVKNGERFFIFNEKGSLIVANLSPEGYKEIDKAKLVEPTQATFGRKIVWSHPAFAEKCVFVRNDKELACFSLAKE
jgi:outer membrane protein assembly factor BamB